MYACCFVPTELFKMQLSCFYADQIDGKRFYYCSMISVSFLIECPNTHRYTHREQYLTCIHTRNKGNIIRKPTKFPRLGINLLSSPLLNRQVNSTIVTLRRTITLCEV